METPVAAPIPETTPTTRAADSVLWVGPREGPEFAEAFLFTAQRTCVLHNSDLSTAEPDQRITQLVVACPRPIASAGDLVRLREASSQARHVQLLGVWCEGEGRTGVVVPGYERVFWHAWPGWWRQQFGGAAADERVDSVIQATHAGAVALAVRDRELAAALAETLQRAGIAVAKSLSAGVSAVIWDGSQLSGREADDLADLARSARCAGASVVVLVDFPRPETVAAARALGARVVLGKPFGEAALLTALRDASQSVMFPQNRPRDSRLVA